jgi:leader peptidase (prepilin peptidase)/N-methyltransferase
MTIINSLLSMTLDVILFASLVGLISGSFVNVLAYRLPLMIQYRWINTTKTELRDISDPDDSSDAYLKKLSLHLPRSHCQACKNPIKAWENIPIVSYIFLNGKCSKCSSSISKLSVGGFYWNTIFNQFPISNRIIFFSSPAYPNDH